jgi:hypothetical protein
LDAVSMNKQPIAAAHALERLFKCLLRDSRVEQLRPVEAGEGPRMRLARMMKTLQSRGHLRRIVSHPAPLKQNKLEWATRQHHQLPAPLKQKRLEWATQPRKKAPSQARRFFRSDAYQALLSFQMFISCASAARRGSRGSLWRHRGWRYRSSPPISCCSHPG